MTIVGELLWMMMSDGALCAWRWWVVSFYHTYKFYIPVMTQRPPENFLWLKQFFLTIQINIFTWLKKLRGTKCVKQIQSSPKNKHEMSLLNTRRESYKKKFHKKNKNLLDNFFFNDTSRMFFCMKFHSRVR